MIWCMKRTNIYLAKGQAAALDPGSAGSGCFPGRLIRELIGRVIGGHPGADLAADLAAVDESFHARFDVSEQVAWRAANLMREYRRPTAGSAWATTSLPRPRSPKDWNSPR
jgi:hypothetical protein